MKISDLLIEEASTGSTTAGNIAVVVNPLISNPNLKNYKNTGRKKNKPTDNALDLSNNLFGEHYQVRVASDSAKQTEQ